MAAAETVAWVRPPELIRGLDHLGVQAPCIALYGQLLPGITNVTDRARYYSFHPWILWAFERQYTDHSLDEFQRILRRAECRVGGGCEQRSRGQLNCQRLRPGRSRSASLSPGRGRAYILELLPGLGRCADSSRRRLRRDLLGPAGAFRGCVPSISLVEPCTVWSLAPPQQPLTLRHIRSRASSRGLSRM